MNSVLELCICLQKAFYARNDAQAQTRYLTLSFNNPRFCATDMGSASLPENFPSPLQGGNERYRRNVDRTISLVARNNRF